MARRSPIGLALALVSVLTVPAFADGTHGTKVKVENLSDSRIFVRSFNGDDPFCVSGHQSKGINPGDTKVLKCHGRGRKRCKIATGVVDFDDNLCKNFKSTCPEEDARTVNVPDKGTLRVMPKGEDCVIEEGD